MDSYQDIRDSWRCDGSGVPWGWTKEYGYMFKSCPICDSKHPPTVTAGLIGENQEMGFIVECSRISHCVRVEAATALEASLKWNNRSRQDRCFRGSNSLKVNPFEEIVEVQPVRVWWSSVPDSAHRIFRGKKDYLVPRGEILYLDGDKHNGYYIATWNTTTSNDWVCSRNEWNCRMGIEPYFQTPKEKRFFGFGEYFK